MRNLSFYILYARVANYLVLVHNVREAEENSSGRHDERADHRVYEAHHQNQEQRGVNLPRKHESTRNILFLQTPNNNYFLIHFSQLIRQ